MPDLLQQTLSPEADIPLYSQLKQLIMSSIEDNTYKEGDPIPTELELAAHFGVSRSTIRQAIAELAFEGWLIRKSSKGTFVTHPDSVGANVIHSHEPFYQQVQRSNKTASTQLLNLSVVPAGEELAAKMKISPQDMIISIFRLRSADSTPMVTIQNYLPYALCSFILSENFSEVSLYEVLMSHPETHIAQTHSIVSAVPATADDTHLLHIARTTPVLSFHNIATRKDGLILDYAFSRYRGDINKFEFVDVPHLRKI